MFEITIKATMSSMNSRFISYNIKPLIVVILLFIFTFNMYSPKIMINNQRISHQLSNKTNNPKVITSENAAVIVEFRSTPLLVTVILNIIQNIPEDWPAQIFHTTSNSQFIRTSRLAKYIQTGKIILTQLDEYSGSFAHYINLLFGNISFWQLVQGEKSQFFQIDSIMCSNSPHKITDYLEYDYVGAPWAHFQGLVGNGGFSLRSKSKTITLLQKTFNSSSRYDGNENEDVWYARNMPTVGHVAPSHVAKSFAVETIFYPYPMGVHKTELRVTELKQLCDVCPEARLVLPFCKS